MARASASFSVVRSDQLVSPKQPISVEKIDENQSGCCCRLGKVDFQFVDRTFQSISTPCLAIQCPRGVPRFLTIGQLQEIFSTTNDSSLLLSLPLCDVYLREKQLSEYESSKNLKGREFLGMRTNVPLILTFRDSSQNGLTVFGRDSSVGLQLESPSGRFDYKPSFHAEAIRCLQPNLVILPAEELSNESSIGTKRQKRSVEKAKDLYAIFQKALVLKNDMKHCTGCLWNIQGGSNLVSRDYSSSEANNFLKEKLDDAFSHRCAPIGVSVGGLGYGETLKEMKTLLAASLAKVPFHTLRFTQIIGQPMEVLEAVWHGVDIIETTYPILAAERAIAFAFSTTLPSTYEGNISSDSDVDQLISEIFENKDISGAHVYELSNVELYRKDLRKLSPDQTTGETLAYIHHLFNCGEMLGPLLVYRHNLRIYANFFKQIRKYVHSKKALAAYISWFANTQTQPGSPKDLKNYSMSPSYTTFADSIIGTT